MARSDYSVMVSMNFTEKQPEITPPVWRSAIFRPAAINTRCSVVCIHPWSDGAGNQQPSGNYLSPPNAINALLPYLSSAGSLDIVVLMLTAPSSEAFLSMTSQFADVFPVPDITRLSRKIKSLAELATTRMQIPAKPAIRLPDAVPLSVQTTSLLNGAEAIAAAVSPAALSIDGLGDMLSEFKAARAQALDELRNIQSTLQQKACPVWCFSCQGDAALAIKYIRENIPHPEQVFTAVLLFAGENLSALRGALHDADDYSGA